MVIHGQVVIVDWLMMMEIMWITIHQANFFSEVLAQYTSSDERRQCNERIFRESRGYCQVHLHSFTETNIVPCAMAGSTLATSP